MAVRLQPVTAADTCAAIKPANTLFQHSTKSSSRVSRAQHISVALLPGGQASRSVSVKLQQLNCGSWYVLRRVAVRPVWKDLARGE